MAHIQGCSSPSTKDYDKLKYACVEDVVIDFCKQFDLRTVDEYLS
jgi:hypothetical protein